VTWSDSVVVVEPICFGGGEEERDVKRRRSGDVHMLREATRLAKETEKAASVIVNTVNEMKKKMAEWQKTREVELSALKVKVVLLEGELAKMKASSCH
jgi:hypothetical protein